MHKTNLQPGEQLQLATFYVADLCLALEIDQIQEILRDVCVTPVPHAPPEVVGVVNLRGEITTVVDLRRVLGLQSSEPAAAAPTLIVRSQGESIGLAVDRVGDIFAVDSRSIVPPPPNVTNVDGRFFRGVCSHKSDFIVLLDLEETLCSSTPTVSVPA